jgi:hypothetical protein
MRILEMLPEPVFESALLWASGVVVIWFAVLWIAVALAAADPGARPKQDTTPQPNEPSPLPILVPRELAGRMTLLAHKLQEDHNRGYLRLPHQYRQHVPIDYVLELSLNELEGHLDRRPTHCRPVHQITYPEPDRGLAG